MKKILIVILLIIGSINVAQATNWKKIEDNIYYDTDTIEYTDGGVRFWLKNNISNGSVKELIYLNLAEKKITTEQSYTYNKSDALVSSSKSSVSERIIPDTISELVYHYFSKNINASNNNFFENGKTNISDVDFAPYMRELQRRIKLNWNPPKANSTQKTVVSMKIAKDGRLISSKIKQSSGSPSTDRAALTAIELTAPFRPLPSNYNGQSVDIDFTFNNVIGGSNR